MKKLCKARSFLCTTTYRLIDQANSAHEPILITGKRANAVLISEEDWRGIQETIYLLSIPNIRESIEGIVNVICVKNSLLTG